jgi:MoaA/NifB/PqqE/SkfB family radical SAM enzyme|tara:strand:- start:2867 stop:4201 length:1335 start_codon:yes stop_codon:yes gene_type:complete
MENNSYNIQKLKDSKSFCIAPWMSAHTWPDGRVLPCCLYNTNPAEYEETDKLIPPFGNVNDSELKDVWNSNKYKEMRVQMLDGKKPSGCSRCYHLEDNNESSYRQKFTRDFEHTFEMVNQTEEDGHLNDMKLYAWDFRISNFCNFKCRSCGVDLSSSWYTDQIALFPEEADFRKKGLISVTDKSSFMDMINPHYQYVEEIYFAGGEPLMMPEHYEILDKLVEEGRTETAIRYSTNFSKLRFGKKNILDIWKNFKNLSLYISVDGVGNIGEYVRKGYKHQEFIDNIKLFRESGIEYKEFGYMVTYGTLNYLHLFDLIIEFIKEGILDTTMHDKQITVTLVPITQPSYYNCQFLPSWVKRDFKLRLDNFKDELNNFDCDEYFIKEIIQKLKSVYDRSMDIDFNLDEMLELKSYTNKLDKLRSENFNTTFEKYYGNIDNLLIDEKSS